MRRLTLSGRAPLLTASPDVRPLTDDVLIDLADLEFASPLDLVALASLVACSPDTLSIRLVPPKSEPVANYLLRMELQKTLAHRVQVDPPFAPEWPRDETPALVELVRMRDPAEVEALSTRLWDRLERVLPAHACYQILQIIGELLENAATHGANPVGTFLAAQYYSGATSGMPPGFWIAVADAGVGIRAHLANNPLHRHLSDAQAIRAAAQPGVSGTPDMSRGWGLSSVRDAAGHAARGRVVIRSGRAEGRFWVGPEGRTARYAPRLPAIRGTWVLALAGGPGGAEGTD